MASNDLVDMQLYSKDNERYNYMLTVSDWFSRFVFTRILKNKSDEQISNVFQ